MNVILPNGKTISGIPDGTPKEAIMAKAISAGLATEADFGGKVEERPAPEQPAPPRPRPQAAPKPTNPSFLDRATGAAEVAATIGTAAIAEPVAGMAGIAQSLNPFAEDGAGPEAINEVRSAMTYKPESEEGRANLKSLSNMLKPLTDILDSAEKAGGDLGYDLAGPVGGAIGASLPTAISEMLGLGAGRVVGATKRVSKAVPDAQAASILASGSKFDVPVMTTDVLPPKGYAGRFAQSLSEKLGPLGSGTARVSQQKAREGAVQAFADSMDIDIDTPFAADMIKSLDKKTKADINAAGVVRDRAVQSLDRFGEVPLSNTKEAVVNAIKRQKRLGDKGDAALISSLADVLKSTKGGDFSLIKDIRTEVISDLKAIRRGEDTRAAPAVQSVKSAMDKDMMKFAGANDRAAAADWIRSNRAFGEAYSRTKDTELKRILKSGEATPEKIMSVMRGGRPSELKRMAKSMGPGGREAAKKAIIQDALKDSKFFEVDANPNPDAFASALNKANRQQAVKIFFAGEGRKEIDGLTRLLGATRRAQQGSAVVKTGEQIIPAVAATATGMGVYADAMTAIPAVTAVSALLKSYESKPFRNLLLKLANTQKGSKAELEILDLASLQAVAGLQAARKEPEEEQ